MIFKILTLFPEMFEGVLNSSILKRAIGNKLIEVKLINIRDYTKDKYNRTDTPPIGGGAGLIMKCQPIIDALKANSTPTTHKILLSPRGETYKQEKAKELAQNFDDILILCGHYEGIDERVYSYFDEIISIGDYILTGGEIAALALIDSVSRLKEGVITKESTQEESFENSLLEYPQFTEPYDFEGQKVPDILYSGNHKAIQKESLRLTKKYRQDLFDTLSLTKQDKKLLDELESTETPKWEKDAILKGHKFIKNS